MKSSFNKKIKLFYWIIKAFVFKHYKILITGLVVGISVFLIILKILPILPEPKKYYRIGIVGQYSLEELPAEIENLLSVGLTIIDDTGRLLPGLADSWEISSDGLKYTFILKDNILWQDNTAIDAESINYNFQEVEKKVLDKKTLQFVLKEPFSPFLTAVSKPVFKEKNIGAGKYRIEKTEQTTEFLKKIIVVSDKNKISYSFYPNLKSAYISYQLGEVDILKNLVQNPFDKNWLENIKVEEKVKKDQYIAIFLNQKHQLLKEKSFRQALAYAVDFKPNDETSVISPISPNSWAYTSDIKTYNFDNDNAKKLAREYIKDKEINLKISTSEAFLEIAEQLKKSWEENLDIKTNVEVINNLDLDFQIFIGIQEIPLDPDQYNIWHSTAKANIINFNDPRVDKLLEDGRTINDLGKRKEKYFDFQKFLLEECPVIFLIHPKIYTFYRSSLTLPEY